MSYQVDLSGVPINKKGSYLWHKKMNEPIYFTRNNQLFHFIIIGYTKTHLFVEFLGEKKRIMRNFIKNNNLNILFKDKTYHQIGDEINIKTGKVIVTNIYHKMNGKQNFKFYEATCINCNTSSSYRVGRIGPNNSCPVCTNKKIIPGVNSLKDKYPNISKLLFNQEEALTLGQKSSKHTNFICPHCKSIIEDKEIRYVVRFGLFCNHCGYGYEKISYPQLLVTNILRNLPIDVYIEQSFPWSLNNKTGYHRRYDIFLPSENMIIEVHGGHHYIDNVFESITLEQIKNNDRYKKKLAYANGINSYIVVDGRESTKNFIKTSITSNDKIKLLFNKYNIDLNNNQLWDFADEKTKHELQTYKIY